MYLTLILSIYNRERCFAYCQITFLFDTIELGRAEWLGSGWPISIGPSPTL